jgi:hypothetical protein
MHADVSGSPQRCEAVHAIAQPKLWTIRNPGNRAYGTASR